MNKASGGDGIPAELFIWKDDAVKVLHLCQQIWKTKQWPNDWSEDWKRSVFIPIWKKGNAKDCSNYRTIALISHASKVMLKILQASLQQTWIENFQMYKLDLEKAEEPISSCQYSFDHRESKGIPEKSTFVASLTMLKLLIVWMTTNIAKFLKRWEYQTILPVSRETCLQVKK